MKIKSILATLALLACTNSFAQERLDLALWNASKPSSSVSIAPSTKPGEYIIKAVFTDLITSTILARPVLIAAAGKPARIEIGAEPGTMIKIKIDISTDGRNATYVTETLKDGKLDTSHSATLSLAGA
jgi:hypothetical protein